MENVAYETGYTEAVVRYILIEEQIPIRSGRQIFARFVRPPSGKKGNNKSNLGPPTGYIRSDATIYGAYVGAAVRLCRANGDYVWKVNNDPLIIRLNHKDVTGEMLMERAEWHKKRLAARSSSAAVAPTKTTRRSTKSSARNSRARSSKAEPKGLTSSPRSGAKTTRSR